MFIYFWNAMQGCFMINGKKWTRKNTQHLATCQVLCSYTFISSHVHLFLVTVWKNTNPWNIYRMHSGKKIWLIDIKYAFSKWMQASSYCIRWSFKFQLLYTIAGIDQLLNTYYFSFLHHSLKNFSQKGNQLTLSLDNIQIFKTHHTERWFWKDSSIKNNRICFPI